MEVKVVESSLVTPSEATPQKSLWLSPLDLMATRNHTPLVYFYRSNDAMDDFFDVARVKAALAKTLVTFYPLAGRIHFHGDGEVDCGGQGALFVVARSNLTVDDFAGSFKPSPELKRLFVPSVESRKDIIYAAQVTFLKCGGVALGMTLHHFVVDAISTFHFVQTWAAVCRHGADGARVVPPCHDRTLLRPRSPPVVHPDALSVFSLRETICLPSAPLGKTLKTFGISTVSRSVCPMMNVAEASPSSSASGELALGCEAFVMSKNQVDALKLACGGRVSTFCALTAHIRYIIYAC